jgi:hypothetical protein
MKRILILCAAVLFGGIAYSAWRYLQPEHYGHQFSGAPSVSLRELVAKGAAAEAPDVRVEGKIVRQCPATGCWFYIDDGRGNQVKVELGKVVPRLPQKIGKSAVVEGRMVQMGDEPIFAGNGVEFKR